MGHEALSGHTCNLPSFPHFSDTTFTSVLDPDSGSYVGLDTVGLS